MIWHPSAGSHRAIASSLPFLARARSVIILVDPASNAEEGAMSLAEGLHLRGIPAKMAPFRRSGSVNDLEQARRHSPDLVVSDASILRSRWMLQERKDRVLRSMKNLLLVAS